jgi:hypothetical protein
VVRFTNVDPEHLDGLLGEIEEHGEPPVDIPAKSIGILMTRGSAPRP